MSFASHETSRRLRTRIKIPIDNIWSQNNPFGLQELPCPVAHDAGTLAWFHCTVVLSEVSYRHSQFIFLVAGLHGKTYLNFRIIWIGLGEESSWRDGNWSSNMVLTKLSVHPYLLDVVVRRDDRLYELSRAGK